MKYRWLILVALMVIGCLPTEAVTQESSQTSCADDGHGSSDIRSTAWFKLAPTGGKACEVFHNRGYTSCYNKDVRGPIWVMYEIPKLTTDPITHPRPSRFTTDKRTYAWISHSDYTHSGYDRGHMAPNYAIDTRYGVEAQKDTFLMSNVSPQLPGLNRGPWKVLESWVAKEGSAEKDGLWVWTGPVYCEMYLENFNIDCDIALKMPSGVYIPWGFFKVIVDVVPTGIEVHAYLMPQDAKGSYSKFKVSLPLIEKVTGLKFTTTRNQVRN